MSFSAYLTTMTETTMTKNPGKRADPSTEVHKSTIPTTNENLHPSPFTLTKCLPLCDIAPLQCGRPELALSLEWGLCYKQNHLLGGEFLCRNF